MFVRPKRVRIKRVRFKRDRYKRDRFKRGRYMIGIREGWFRYRAFGEVEHHVVLDPEPPLLPVLYHMTYARKGLLLFNSIQFNSIREEGRETR